MRIVVISDTHCQHDKIELPDADMIIHCGDYSGTGTIPECGKFFTWFSELPYKYKLFINGNHEIHFERNPSLYKSMIPDNVIYLEDSSVEIEGFNFYGSPRTPEFFDWAYMYKKGVAAYRVWKNIPENTDVLITHGPAYRLLDFSSFKISGRTDQNVGCEKLREAIDLIKPKLHVCGHIHGAYGRLRHNNTLHLNASICNEAYKPFNKPFVVDTDTWETV